MATVKPFEDLEIWKPAKILCNDINKIANSTELRKDYKPYGQIDGASGSVRDNIAEGFERNGNREFIRFFIHLKSILRGNKISTIQGLDRNYVDTQ